MVKRLDDIDGLAVWGHANVKLHIMHAFQLGVLRFVDFNNDFACRFQHLVIVPNAHGRHNFAVRSNGGRFDNRHIKRPVKALANLLLYMRQVHILVINIACVNAFAQNGVRLEWTAKADCICFRQYAVTFGGGRSTCNDAHGKRLASSVLRLGFFSNGGWQRFGVTCASKTTHAQCHAVLNPLCRLLGRHDFFTKQWVQNTRCLFHGRCFLINKWMGHQWQKETTAQHAQAKQTGPRARNSSNHYRKRKLRLKTASTRRTSILTLCIF